MSVVQGDRTAILARSLHEIRRLRGELDEARRLRTEPIAIVGMSCRMPGGATDPDAFWRFLRRGGDGIREVPPSRWDARRFARDAGRTAVARAGLLDDVEHFDAGFFGISRREAASLDPQQRLLLEVSWEALERAGQSPDELAGTATGVFFGVTSYDYCQLVMQHVEPGDLDAYALTSNASTFAAGRLSYWLGLTGPSLSVDTACSSSLVGLHLACQSLRAGECATALAGGVNVLLSPEWFVVLEKARMLAPDGRCKTFDASADGYVRSEGCGVVVLRRLSDALAHHDRVLALIRGSAVNQDGRGSGITVPNPAAQQAVVRSALEAGGVRARDVSYVEAHGTGTPLGDPIELRALDAVFGNRDADAPLLVGSVKTNVGHLEPAAGMAGLIKVVCSLEHGEIPPHLHLRDVNPEIGLDELAVRIPTDVTPWPAGDAPRVAGISSFGASGTNAHVIVQEPPADERVSEPAGDRPRLLTLSAKSEPALRELAARYRDRLADDELDWADACFTAATGRAQMRHRLAVVADSTAEAARLLDDQAGLQLADAMAGEARRGVVFMFTGQGAQHPAMGQGLYDAEPVFRAQIDRCDEILRERAGLSLSGLLASDNGAIHETSHAQPALFALEYALAALWRHWGIEPRAVLGHSIGELVAATVAGVLSLEDGLLLAARRGELMQATEPGAMAAAFAPEERVRELLRPYAADLSIAAVNGPTSIVVSGRPDALSDFVGALDAADVRSKPIAVTRGFHSPLMDPILDELEAVAASMAMARPAIELVSNVSGSVLEPGDSFDAAYVRAHARRAVRFEAGLRALHDAGHRTFLEIGPTPTLAGLARGVFGDAGDPPLVLASMRPKHDDRRTILDSAAALHVRGHELDLARLDERRSRRRVVLPSYPFQRSRDWLPATRGAAASRRPAGDEPSETLLGARVDSPLDHVQFESVLGAGAHPCLGDCVMGDTPIVNIGVFLELAMSAHRELAGPGDVAVEGCVVRERLALEAGATRRVQLVLDDAVSGARAFRVHAAAEPEPGWRLHALGSVRAAGPRDPRDPPPAPATGVIDGDEFYERMLARGLRLGPSARWIDRLSADGRGEAVAEMRAPRGDETGRYLLHPGLTDALFQLLFACLPAGVSGDATYLIAGIDRFVVREHDPRQPLRARATLLPSADPETMLLARAELFDAEGRAVVLADGVCLGRATSAQPRQRSAEPATRPAAEPPATLTPERVRTLVIETVAAALGASAGDLHLDEPLRNLGLDSLMAFEIKDGLSLRLGVSLPLVTFLEGHSVDRLSEEVAALAGQPSPAARQDDAAAAEPQAASLPQITPDPDRRGEPFALTDLQEAYLIGRSPDFELGGVATTFLVEVDVDDLDLDRAQRALRRVVARHDMLRVVVRPDGAQQVLDDVAPYEIRVTDLAGAQDAAARLGDIRRELEQQVRDPAVWPLFDIRATVLDASTTRLHVLLDALIIDAWSTSLMFREWAGEYRGEQHAEPGLTFRDYVCGVRGMRGGELHAASLAYWTERAATLPPAPELPLACTPAAIGKPAFTHRSARLDEQRWSRFRELATASGVTASAAICAAYAHVLATWSRSEHFTLNLLFFNRLPLHPDVEKVIGNFSATTLLEVRSDPADTFAARAQRLQRQMWSDLEHRHVSGVEILRELNRSSREGARATMPVVFASTVSFAGKQDDGATGLARHLVSLGSGGREVSSSIRTPQVWLDHQVVDDDATLVVNWDAVEGLFAPGVLDAMFGAYTTLLEQLCDDEDSWSRPLPALISQQDLRRRRAANATAAAAPAAPRLLHEGFAAMAAEQPERCAVISGDRQIAYGELDAIARGVAARLRAEGEGPGSLVPVVMEKGWEQVAAVLAVLRCGAAYVPIDPEVPPARLRMLLDTTGARSVLTQPPVGARLQWPQHVRPIAVDDAAADAAGPASCADIGPGDLAYVIFTSGSTGVPKGVMIEHGAALNTVLDVNERFGVGRSDRVLALSALNFDLSVWDVFGLLTAGGTVVVPDPSARLEPAHWADLVERHGVTLWNSVPQLMEMFAEHMAGARREAAASLRLVMMSGDWIALSLPDRIREVVPQASQWSLGGATEASIWSILHPIEAVDPAWASVPYGTPMRNQQFHVLDAALRPRPQWVPGQLYIGGDGLARGYLADDAKTRASFIHHPATGERLYRTGDLGRYLPDGTIEFLGREDSQVKIQGFRVELGEVESALEGLPGVRSAVAVASGPARGPKRLIAYVMPAGTTPDADGLLAELRELLPGYLVPQVVMFLDAIPLTGNGKVDRRALPAPDQAQVTGPRGLAPRDAIEARLVAIWAGFFGDREVTINADFFELGGNSLTAVRLMAQIRREWGKVLALSALFAHPTIELLAPLLRAEDEPGERGAIVPIRVRCDEPPLIFVHPVGGDVVCYAGLAAALGDMPFVAVQSPDLDGEPSLGELAALYVEALREAVPAGPYRLGGWSMGGIIALEMARRIQALGEEVEFVAVVDLLEPPGSGSAASAPDILAWFAHDLAALAGASLDVTPADLPEDRDAALAAICALAKDAGALPRDVDLATMTPIFERFARNCRALLSHRPEPVGGRVRFFRAADGGASRETAAAWLALFGGDAEVVDLPGDHYSVMRSPALELLAGQLRVAGAVAGAPHPPQTTGEPQ